MLSEEERAELVSHMRLLNMWVETQNKLSLHDSPAQERQQLEMRSMGRASGVHKTAVLCKMDEWPKVRTCMESICTDSVMANGWRG